jgi:hypothetical protein
VAYWLRRAVELGDDDGEVISPRTILKASETVFGRGLDCFWASTWAAAGLALAAAVQVSFPLFLFSVFFSIFCFYFLVSICYLDSNLNSGFALQVLKHLNINIT